MPDFYIEVGHWQEMKANQRVAGDNVLAQRMEGSGRVISVLADGLGSGIKASVLATLSSTMALKFIANNIDLQKTTQLIMASLPICQERKVAYSTFTIVDMEENGQTRVIEYENPSFILMRGSELIEVPRDCIQMPRGEHRDMTVHYTEFTAQLSDRIIFFSDGVSQAGTGSENFPLGWKREGALSCVENALAKQPDISATDLARKIVQRATYIDGGKAGDDITCEVIYLRKPRHTAVFTGPPLDPANTDALAERVRDWPSRKVICGGTTSEIIAKALGLTLEMELSTMGKEVPPISRMDGVNLVTEGAITLTRAASILEYSDGALLNPHDGAEMLVKELLESDIITFFVGGGINEANLYANGRAVLDIRRNIVNRIVGFLETKFLKRVEVNYL